MEKILNLSNSFLMLTFFILLIIPAIIVLMIMDIREENELIKKFDN